MREVSRRQAKLVELYFAGGLPASKAALLAGFRGKTTAALCNAAKRVLDRFAQDPQRFFTAMAREARRDWREWHLKNLRALREKLEREERGENH